MGPRTREGVLHVEASSGDTSEVTVRFLVQVGSTDFVPEPLPFEHPLTVGSYRRVRGGIAIRTGGLPPAIPEDELVPLVSSLCFGAVAEVLSRQHAVVAFTDTYGYLRLDHEGGRIRLSGDRLPDIFFVPPLPLLDALVNCGARFRAWLPRCGLEGDLASIDRELGILEARAREALAGTKRARD